MKESRLAGVASWAVLGASFGLSATTWVALAVLAGFTGSIFGLPVTWLMPVAVDGYVVVALVVWMSPVPPKVAAFAKANTYAAASIGVAAQSAYHALSVLTDTHIVWRAIMAAVVGALPPAVAALTVHLRALLRRELAATSQVASIVSLDDVVEPTVTVTPDKQNGRLNGSMVPTVELVTETADRNGKAVVMPTPNRWASDRERQEQAQARYLESVREGRPLTGKALGEEFDRSPSWGRGVIREAGKVAA